VIEAANKRRSSSSVVAMSVLGTTASFTITLFHPVRSQLRFGILFSSTAFVKVFTISHAGPYFTDCHAIEATVDSGSEKTDFVPMECCMTERSSSAIP
jgi:hypothetical protein